MTSDEKAEYNLVLEKDYPKPIVDFGDISKRALATFKSLSE